MKKILLVSVLFLIVFVSNAQKPSEVWSVYPNPVKEDLYVDIKGMLNANYTIALHDVLGNIIFKIDNTNSNSYRFSLKEYDLNKGFYFIKLTSGNEVFIKKIMIKN